MNNISIPNPMLITGITMYNIKFGGLVLIKYKAILFKVRVMTNPIQRPIQNIPALGKYPRIYPTKKLEITVKIKTFCSKFSGTPFI